MNENKTRNEMVEALTLEAIDYIREAMLRGDTGLLGDYLELGFIGYSHMDEEELRTEYEMTIGEEDKA
jgi:hypothetical protein